MKRNGIGFLDECLQAKDRKPLITQGARQVGKTWLVRDLAKCHNRTLIENNFEKNPHNIPINEFFPLPTSLLNKKAN